MYLSPVVPSRDLRRRYPEAKNDVKVIIGELPHMYTQYIQTEYVAVGSVPVHHSYARVTRLIHVSASRAYADELRYSPAFPVLYKNPKHIISQIA